MMREPNTVPIPAPMNGQIKINFNFLNKKTEMKKSGKNKLKDLKKLG